MVFSYYGAAYLAVVKQHCCPYFTHCEEASSLVKTNYMIAADLANLLTGCQQLLPPTNDAFRHLSSYLSNMHLVNVMLPKPTTSDPIIWCPTTVDVAHFNAFQDVYFVTINASVQETVRVRKIFM